MAYIDKTYTASYDEYKAFVKWAKSRRKKFKMGKRGCIVYNPSVWTLMDCIYSWKKKDFDGTELPVMNTPEKIDRYLIKYCPFEFVQNRMKEVYSTDFYNKYANPPAKIDD